MSTTHTGLGKCVSAFPPDGDSWLRQDETPGTTSARHYTKKKKPWRLGFLNVCVKNVPLGGHPLRPTIKALGYVGLPDLEFRQRGCVSGKACGEAIRDSFCGCMFDDLQTGWRSELALSAAGRHLSDGEWVLAPSLRRAELNLREATVHGFEC